MKWLMIIAGLLGACAALPANGQTIKFTEIDCAQSEIVIARYTRCGRSNYYAANAQGGSAGGQYYDQYAGYKGPLELIWAVLQRSRTQDGSFVYSAESRDKILLGPAPEVVRDGVNFSGTRRIAGGHIKTFAMPGWSCFSYVRDAPYKGAGIEYSLWGYTCGDARWHNEAHAVQFLAALAVRPGR